MGGNDRAAVIEELLRESGGRLWQSDIVDQLGVTKGAISQTMADIEESGAIKRIRLGRANLVCLPESVPDWYGPTDELEEAIDGD